MILTFSVGSASASGSAAVPDDDVSAVDVDVWGTDAVDAFEEGESVVAAAPAAVAAGATSDDDADAEAVSLSRVASEFSLVAESFVAVAVSLVVADAAGSCVAEEAAALGTVANEPRSMSPGCSGNERSSSSSWAQIT